jgi:hypothetical protein
MCKETNPEQDSEKHEEKKTKNNNKESKLFDPELVEIWEDILAEKIYQKALSRSHIWFTVFLGILTVIFTLATYFGFEKFKDIESNIDQQVKVATDKLDSKTTTYQELLTDIEKNKNVIDDLKDQGQKAKKQSEELKIEVKNTIAQGTESRLELAGTNSRADKQEETVEKFLADAERENTDNNEKIDQAIQRIRDEANLEIQKIKDEAATTKQESNAVISELKKALQDANSCHVLAVRQDAQNNLDSLDFKFGIGGIKNQSFITAVEITDEMNPENKPTKFNNLQLGQKVNFSRQENFVKNTYSLEVLMLEEHEKEDKDSALFKVCGKFLDTEDN